MTDVQKEESQKTVVSFIFGLLIGGLLVWAFMGGDGQKDEDKVKNEKKSDEVATSTEIKIEEVVAVTPTLTVGEGKVTVSDTKAGKEVKLGETVYPIEEGWIGVREYTEGGKLGWIYGVIRFSKAGNVVPTSIPLVTPTVAGREYAVVMFTAGGDKTFNSATDKQLDTIFTTFKAE